MDANRRVFRTTSYSCEESFDDGAYHFCDTVSYINSKILNFDENDHFGPESDWLIDTQQPFNVNIEYKRGKGNPPTLKETIVTLTQGTK